MSLPPKDRDFGLRHNSGHQDVRCTRLDCETDWESEHIVITWGISEFDKLRLCSINGDGGVISSPTKQDSSGRQWCLRLYPCSQTKGVGLYVHCKSPDGAFALEQKAFDYPAGVTDRDNDVVHFGLNLSVLDEEGRPMKGMTKLTPLHKFVFSHEDVHERHTLGAEDLISETDVETALLKSRPGSLLVRGMIRIFEGAATRTSGKQHTIDAPCIPA